MYRVGVDLGGTNIAVGIVNEAYQILGRASVKTALPQPAEGVCDRIAEAIRLAAADAGVELSQLDGIGIGSPGLIDPVAGVVTFANNLGFENVPLAAMVSERVGGLPCAVGNDANAAAYGEFIAGSGKGTTNFIMVTIGTGIGGGIIINRHIYAGSNHAGGEIGHIVIESDGLPCSCGKRGCFERYASATALIGQTKAAMQNAPHSKMWELCGGDIDRVSGRTAWEARAQGDATAAAVVEQYIRYLSVGVSSIITIFQPDALCLGGGVSLEGRGLTDPLHELIYETSFLQSIKEKSTITTATLGNDAGIIGAAFLQDAN